MTSFLCESQHANRWRERIQREGVSVARLANARAGSRLSVLRELDPSKHYFYQLQRARAPEVADLTQELRKLLKKTWPSEQHQQVAVGQQRAKRKGYSDSSCLLSNANSTSSLSCTRSESDSNGSSSDKRSHRRQRATGCKPTGPPARGPPIRSEQVASITWRSEPR